MKSTLRPPTRRRAWASATTRRKSATPALTAESLSKCAPVERATISASVVFPGAGRTPENHRRDAIALDRATQRAAFTDDLALTDELFERARTHARCERRIRLAEERVHS